MNIQIFGTKKSFDTKKAQRYFKERRIKFQFIDLKEKGDEQGRARERYALRGRYRWRAGPRCKGPGYGRAHYLSGREPEVEKLLENQQVLREPIVRNGRQATVGYQPDVWKGWE